MMHRLIRPLTGLLLGLSLLLSSFSAALAQGAFSGLARAERAGTALELREGVVHLRLTLSQPVPWRLRYLADPARVLLDFREVDFRGLDLSALRAPGVAALRAGPVADGWSRLVLSFERPHLARLSEMKTGQGERNGALLRLELHPADAESFAAEAKQPDPPAWALPRPAVLAPPRPPRGEAPLVVMLDPGHGGLDPGAEYAGHSEADLMLTFARELKEALIRAGISDVRLTRDADRFVPLETRIALAQAAGASVFLSLHADAVTEGVARGATLYSLSHEASDAAAAALAERHDRDALMAGVDLTGQDDVIAGVLMDMARTETAPRTAQLSAELVAAMRAAGIPLHRRPERRAAFSVLKSPDIPSLLIEVGYLSTAQDLKRLLDPAWRAQMAGAIVAGLKAWAVRDAAQSGLMRQ